MLEEVRRKAIRPDAIERIPVRDCPDLDVDEADEVAVFNQPRYWSGMPVYEKADYVLKRLRDVFHYKVFIFSWRPWPSWSLVTPSQRKQWKSLWRGTSISRITKEWLHDKGIPYDRLIVEKGNADSPDRVGKVRNRYIIAQDCKIRLFVEDDLDKARKLADACEVVFLMKHPYNRVGPTDEALPSNIVEVDGWKEIYRWIKENL